MRVIKLVFTVVTGITICVTLASCFVLTWITPVPESRRNPAFVNMANASLLRTVRDTAISNGFRPERLRSSESGTPLAFYTKTSRDLIKYQSVAVLVFSKRNGGIALIQISGGSSALDEISRVRDELAHKLKINVPNVRFEITTKTELY